MSLISNLGTNASPTVRAITRHLGIAAALLVLGAAPIASAQDAAYRARLSPMPTTPQTKAAITGEGEATAILNGATLTVSGKFAGMSSTATMAHLHLGPPAQPGPVFAALIAPASTSGVLNAEVELNAEQLAALKKNSLYVQIHTSTNPAGELRGWLFARAQ